MVGEARTKQGRKSSTRFLIVDAQSVKNSDSAGQKGYDAGKKISGIKRHIAVDTQGFPHAIAVTTAEVTDRKGALLGLSRCSADLQLLSVFWLIVAMSANPLPSGSMRCWVRKLKLPNGVNFTPLLLCLSVGLLNAHLLGLRNTAVYGKTASVSLIPACSLSILPSFPSC